MSVLDTSLAVDFLLGTGAAEDVEAIFSDEPVLLAPDILVFEAVAVLRRAAARDALSSERAAAAVADLGDLSVELFPALALRQRAWELRQNLTVADALFVALAEAADEPLLTRDARMARAAERHADVEVRVL